MLEDRLVKIETKIAYQEDLVEELNKTIYQQQQKLERLEAACRSLAGHIEALTAVYRPDTWVTGVRRHR